MLFVERDGCREARTPVIGLTILSASHGVCRETGWFDADFEVPSDPEYSLDSLGMSRSIPRGMLS